jgi:hypothetical protein
MTKILDWDTPARLFHWAFAESLTAAIGIGLGVIIALHLLRLAWHTMRHRDSIALAMITGTKRGKPEDTIRPAHAVWGIVGSVVAALWIGALFARHNASRARLRLPGLRVTLQLGEN